VHVRDRAPLRDRRARAVHEGRRRGRAEADAAAGGGRARHSRQNPQSVRAPGLAHPRLRLQVLAKS